MLLWPEQKAVLVTPEKLPVGSAGVLQSGMDQYGYVRSVIRAYP